MNSKTYQARMTRKLTEALAPTELIIEDNSASHIGHAAHNPLGETHFSVFIVSPKFENMSSVARHREVYRLLADELKERVHALSLKTFSPSEYNHR